MLAFDIMREYPELVRSVVLEDPVPPGVSADAISVSELAGVLDRYAAQCRANASCNRAFPDIEGQLKRDYMQYQKSPVTVMVSPPKRGSHHFPY